MVQFIIISYKIRCIKKRMKRLEKGVIDFRNDMILKNNLYYCGRGDVQSFVDEQCHHVYMKIAAYDKLLDRYKRKHMAVVGKSSGKILKAVAGKNFFKLVPCKLIKTN